MYISWFTVSCHLPILLVTLNLPYHIPQCLQQVSTIQQGIGCLHLSDKMRQMWQSWVACSSERSLFFQFKKIWPALYIANIIWTTDRLHSYCQIMAASTATPPTQGYPIKKYGVEGGDGPEKFSAFNLFLIASPPPLPSISILLAIHNIGMCCYALFYTPYEVL